MFPLAEHGLWHRRLLVEEAPLEDAAVMHLAVVDGRVMEVVPVDPVDGRHRHDGPVTRTRSLLNPRPQQVDLVST